ncbi:hypothetical protein [Cohnella fermenti]|uniref:Uncharacterized protein n=1 Tax=Cohnella fermenti TaxID=2565925 RepID=A0A4S4BFF1_9BACL|nr:hypothetical protein [Cohnella fermenti]THF73049.1 hypothetical protein E6C55_30900 [Cohnella fermenti]
MKKKITLLASLVVIVSAVVFLSIASAANPSDQAKTAIPRPIGIDPSLYKEDPAPEFVGNTDLPQSALITKDNILSVFTDDSKLKSANDSKSTEDSKAAELTTWGEFEKAKGDGSHSQISADRQVWVLKGSFSEYQDIRLGLVKNAQVTLVFDAETGVKLYKQIASDQLERIGG